MCHKRSGCIKSVGCQHRGAILEEVSDRSEDSVPLGFKGLEKWKHTFREAIIITMKLPKMKHKTLRYICNVSTRRNIITTTIKLDFSLHGAETFPASASTK